LTTIAPEQPRRLSPTFSHPLSSEWAGPAGPWPTQTLDEAITSEDGLVNSVAGGLMDAGIRRGDTVCWQKANGPEAIALFRAAWRLGAVAAPIHHLAGPIDRDVLLSRLRPALYLGAEDSAPVGRPITSAPEPVDPADLAIALATSGSTGSPKLALHTHRSLLYKAGVMAAVHSLDSQDCVLLCAPLAHISGLLYGVLMHAFGVRSVPMAKWDADQALELIERERVTFMAGPPTFFASMISCRTFEPRLVRSLRLISCGGAGVTPAFVRSASSSLGCQVKRSYGSTEAPTVATATQDDDPENAATTDGRAVGVAELRVVADGAGEPVPFGVAGELWVRGPELCEGYDDAEATAASFTHDGWFKTGDLATIRPDGWMTIVGRVKDVIIRGGENIASPELEAVLESHPSVREAVVVGFPDERLGERVCAFVVTAQPFDLTICRSWFEACGIAKFKWPERVVNVESLPVLASGKPDRKALRALAQQS
jgi:cyclohexanecarboxylate-CoA ligase